MTNNKESWEERFEKEWQQIVLYHMMDGTSAARVKSFISEEIKKAREEVIDAIPEATKDFGDAKDFNEKDQTKFSYAVLYHNARLQALKQSLRERFKV